MSIREVPMYQIICDSCGKDAHEFSDNSTWSGPDCAWADAEESGFVRLDEQDLCWECWHHCEGDEVAAPGKLSACSACKKAGMTT